MMINIATTNKSKTLHAEPNSKTNRKLSITPGTSPRDSNLLYVQNPTHTIDININIDAPLPLPPRRTDTRHPPFQHRRVPRK